jgi:uncharacterized phage protein gp47/JayE
MSVVRNNAAVANQINPDLAGGVFLDALWKLTGGQRRVATFTTVPGAALTGQPGTIVPGGSLAETAAGDRFQTVGDVTLAPDGTATVDFIAIESGPVPAVVGTLTEIVSAVLGWETVTNPNAALVGQNGETDAASRRRRKDTLALQGVALPEAITSALNDVDGVQSLQFRENVTDSPAVIDGIAMVPHSIWVCVNGGTDADIAKTLLAKKSMGANWNGAVTVNVVEPASGQTYPVQFDRPTPIAILARVTIRKGSGVADPVGAVQKAILDYAAGEINGERGFIVGGNVSPFELSGAVNEEQPTIYVQKVELTRAAVVNYQPSELVMALNELPFFTVPSSISVVVI